MVCVENVSDLHLRPPNLFWYSFLWSDFASAETVTEEKAIGWAKDQGWKTAKATNICVRRPHLSRLFSKSDLFISLILHQHLLGSGFPLEVFSNIVCFLNLANFAKINNPYLDIYPLRFLKVLVYHQEEREMASSIKEILQKLHRDGFSLADSYRYVGTNPHEIRRTLMASSETDDFIYAMDAFGFSMFPTCLEQKSRAPVLPRKRSRNSRLRWSSW